MAFDPSKFLSKSQPTPKKPEPTPSKPQPADTNSSPVTAPEPEPTPTPSAPTDSHKPSAPKPGVSPKDEPENSETPPTPISPPAQSDMPPKLEATPDENATPDFTKNQTSTQSPPHDSATSSDLSKVPTSPSLQKLQYTIFRSISLPVLRINEAWHFRAKDLLKVVSISDRVEFLNKLSHHDQIKDFWDEIASTQKYLDEADNPASDLFIAGPGLIRLKSFIQPPLPPQFFLFEQRIRPIDKLSPTELHAPTQTINA